MIGLQRSAVTCSKWTCCSYLPWSGCGALGAEDRQESMQRLAATALPEEVAAYGNQVNGAARGMTVEEERKFKFI
jgi:hypothetical protein